MDTKQATEAVPGVIRADESLSLEEFMKRTKLNVAAVRSARRKGLLTRRSGNRKFILGDEWHAYLKTCPTE